MTHSLRALAAMTAALSLAGAAVGQQPPTAREVRRLLDTLWKRTQPQNWVEG